MLPVSRLTYEVKSGAVFYVSYHLYHYNFFFFFFDKSRILLKRKGAPTHTGSIQKGHQKVYKKDTIIFIIYAFFYK